METNSIKYYRHIYQLDNETAWHTEYRQVKNTVHPSILPEAIRIEVNRGYNESKNIDHWFCVYNCPDWKYGNRVTGLRKTYLPNIFEGNLIDPEVKTPQPGSLIFFEFSAKKEILVVDVFKNFYTQNPFAFRLLLEKHNFLLRKKPGTV